MKQEPETIIRPLMRLSKVSEKNVLAKKKNKNQSLKKMKLKKEKFPVTIRGSRDS